MPRVLELGAGSGQHLTFVKHKFDDYLETDIRPEQLPDRSVSYPALKVRREFTDAEATGRYPENYFDRVIATCLYAHLSEPESALREWIRITKPAGYVSVYLPLDPGIFLRVAQSLTVAHAAKKLGLDYWKIHHNEHRYHFEYLVQGLRQAAFNHEYEIKFYPVGGRSWNLNLWAVAQIKKA